MKEYIRAYPLFSLCGLNCGLCPRYHTEGESKCPGCGGPAFHLKHPSCAVITCSRKHGGIEYCCQCEAFPCPRYEKSGNLDSFISYRNVLSDLRRVRQEGLDAYRDELDEKVAILQKLIEDYNDGRRKSFYCHAVNLLPLQNLREVMEAISFEMKGQERAVKEKADRVADLLEAKAKENQIDLKLRK